jgi:hypothetical protein
MGTKNTLLILLFFLIALVTNAQTVIGAWEGQYTDGSDQEIRTVVIFTDGYQVRTDYLARSGKFIHTNGGTWRLDGDTMTEMVEFHSDDPSTVGKEFSFKVELSDSQLSIAGGELKLKRIDAGMPGKLYGAWLMSGRVRDGITQLRDSDRPRKTMKILSGTRFQWIAYNTETGDFMGTGGGTYTTTDGKYIENIEFFSRDDSRVGARLEFDYELKDGNWHHSGLSSKGTPIYEIWSIRNE